MKYSYFGNLLFVFVIVFFIVAGCSNSKKTNQIMAAVSDSPAFPEAEGYGKYTTGGRGGAVYEVTNLNDGGAGSLRAAVESKGVRTVVFRISGTIILNSALKIREPNITIAGQTAPGDGICIRKYPVIIEADNVIIRYIRVRLGNESGDDNDAVSGRFIKHVIIDHVSASWSIDETFSVYHCDSITVQWCMITESMYNSNHVKGAHGFGGIWGANNSTYHHNLIAHHSSRNPRFASGSQNTDFRNNVIYNWGYQSSYGGELIQQGDARFSFSNFNIVANYYKPGPATQPGEVSYRIVNPSTRNGVRDFGSWYVTDNIVEGNRIVSKDNWNGGVQPQGGKASINALQLKQPWPAIPIHQQSADAAFALVVANAGATLPKRDIVDSRIANETMNGFANFEGISYKKKNEIASKSKKCGIIDSQDDVGGWPLLQSTAAPADTDHDGMPDEWEIKQGLNPQNAADRNQLTIEGYTMLEKYINGLM